jgi:membrane-associated phospholipid phosphatase
MTRRAGVQDEATGHRAGPRRELGLVALALTIAFLALAIIVGLGWSAALDASIYPLLLLRQRTVGSDIAQAVNQVSGVAIAFVAATAGTLLAAVRRRRGWLILLAPLATVPIEVLAKNVFPRTMFDNVPYVQLGSLLTISAPYTFPSGNMARVAALVVGLYLHLVHARAVGLGTTAGIAALLIAGFLLAVAAWSHLAIGDHWPTDLLGGLLLGTAAAFAFAGILHGPRTAPPGAS